MGARGSQLGALLARPPSWSAGGLLRHAPATNALPSAATAKISMRLVPEQRPEQAVAAFGQFVADSTPPGVSASVQVNAEARPVLIPLESPAMEAGKAALAEAFGGEVALVRNGA